MTSGALAASEFRTNQPASLAPSGVAQSSASTSPATNAWAAAAEMPRGWKKAFASLAMVSWKK